MTLKQRMEQERKLVSVIIFTSIMLPRLEDTIFWKDMLSRLSFPLEPFKNVVTIFLMASSMSANAETGTKKEWEG